VLVKLLLLVQLELSLTIKQLALEYFIPVCLEAQRMQSSALQYTVNITLPQTAAGKIVVSNDIVTISIHQQNSDNITNIKCTYPTLVPTPSSRCTRNSWASYCWPST